MKRKPTEWKMCLYEIIHGLKMGIDPSLYAKPEFDDRQMSQIRFAMKRGINVSSIAKPEYDSDVMLELNLFTDFGIDVSNFDGSKEMIKEYFEKKFSMEDTEYFKLLCDRLKSIKNVSEYTITQLQKIESAILHLNASLEIINEYINPSMDPEYIYDLLFELTLTPDVSKYTSPDMDYEHISMIAHALNNGVKFEDFKPYLDMYDEYEKQGILKPYVADEFDEDDCDGDCENCLDPCEDFDEDFENGENSVISEKDNKKSSYNKEDALRIAMNLLKGKK